MPLPSQETFKASHVGQKPSIGAPQRSLPRPSSANGVRARTMTFNNKVKDIVIQRPLLPTDLSDTIIPVWRLEPGGSKTIQTTPSHHYQKSVDMLFDAAYIHPGWLFDDIWKNHCLPLVNDAIRGVGSSVIYLSGPKGSGKTYLATQIMKWLIPLVEKHHSAEFSVMEIQGKSTGDSKDQGIEVTYCVLDHKKGEISSTDRARLRPLSQTRWDKAMTRTKGALQAEGYMSNQGQVITIIVYPKDTKIGQGQPSEIVLVDTPGWDDIQIDNKRMDWVNAQKTIIPKRLLTPYRNRATVKEPAPTDGRLVQLLQPYMINKSSFLHIVCVHPSSKKIDLSWIGMQNVADAKTITTRPSGLPRRTSLSVVDHKPVSALVHPNELPGNKNIPRAPHGGIVTQRRGSTQEIIGPKDQHSDLRTVTGANRTGAATPTMLPRPTIPRRPSSAAGTPIMLSRAAMPSRRSPTSTTPASIDPLPKAAAPSLVQTESNTSDRLTLRVQKLELENETQRDMLEALALRVQELELSHRIHISKSGQLEDRSRSAEGQHEGPVTTRVEEGDNETTTPQCSPPAKATRNSGTASESLQPDSSMSWPKLELKVGGPDNERTDLRYSSAAESTGSPDAAFKSVEFGSPDPSVFLQQVEQKVPSSDVTSIMSRYSPSARADKSSDTASISLQSTPCALSTPLVPAAPSTLDITSSIPIPALGLTDCRTLDSPTASSTPTASMGTSTFTAFSASIASTASMAPVPPTTLTATAATITPAPPVPPPMPPKGWRRDWRAELSGSGR